MEMKKIIVSVLMPVLLLAVSCEKNQDFQTVIEAPATLVYVAQAGMDNVQTSSVIVLPDDFITTEKRFQVNVNSNLHGAAQATLTVTPEEVAAYNEAMGTSYPVFPAENLSVGLYVRLQQPLVEAEGEGSEGEGEGEGEQVDPDPFVPSSSATVNIPENERLSTEFIRLRLGGDMSALTEEYYMVALTLTCPGMELSKKKNVYYLLVRFTGELVKSVKSTSDMVGTQIAAATRRNFTADVSSYASLFDNSTSSAVSFSISTGCVVTVDMQQEYKFSGLCLRGANYIYPYIQKLEISTDGENFSSMGEVGEDNYFMSSYQCYSSLIVGINARYVRVTFDFYSPYASYGSNYKDRLAEIYIYAEN